MTLAELVAAQHARIEAEKRRPPRKRSGLHLLALGENYLATTPVQDAAPKGGRYDPVRPRGTWVPRNSPRSASSNELRDVPAIPHPNPTPSPLWERMPRPVKRETPCEDLIEVERVRLDNPDWVKLPKGHCVSSPTTEGPTYADRVSACLAGLDMDRWLEGRPVIGYFGPSLAKWCVK